MSNATTPAVVESTAVESVPVHLGVSLRLASDAVRTKQEGTVSRLFADAIVKGSGYTKAVEAAAKEMRVHRLMFPAHADVIAILGENTPDLAGRTPEYRASWKRVTEGALQLAQEALVEQGASEKAALAMARDEAETFRKSVSRRYRIMIDAEAKKLGPAGPRYLLAHGFAYNGEVGREQVLTKGAHLALASGAPEGSKLTAETAVVVTPTTSSSTKAPEASSDQAKPAETADAKERIALGDEVTNPVAIVNEAVGMLNRAAKLLPNAKLSKRERDALRRALVSAVANVVGELEATMEPGDTVNVAEVARKASK